MIPYGRQDISDEDVEAVVRVLRSDWLTTGPDVARFEQAIAKRCTAKHAVAVSSATAALHIAALALGLGPGKRLWTSPNTFLATANCALYCGAEVDFVDTDPRTYNLSAARLAEKLLAAERAGKLPDVVAPVAFGGQSAEMRAIRELSKRYGFKVLDDASHAIGAEYLGKPVGCGDHADITVFSFHPVKIITTGEGGLLATNSDDLAKRLVELRSHGMTRDPARMTKPPEGPWYYEQIDLGFNYRLTDLQCALGLSQLTRLDAFLARRRELAARYDAALEKLPLVRPWQHPDTRSSFHLYPIRVRAPGRTRREVFDAMRAKGIGVNVHYIPVHTQPWYAKLGFKRGDFPEAEAYYSEAISLPMHTKLTDAEFDFVVKSLTEALRAN